MLDILFVLVKFLLDIFSEIISILIDIILFVLLHYLNFYILACEIRSAFYWFLNINPYVYPWNKLTNFTSFVTKFGAKFYPTIFGFNLAFIINLYLLRKIFINIEIVYYYKSLLSANRSPIKLPKLFYN